MSYRYTWTTVSNRYKRWRDRITPTFWRRRKGLKAELIMGHAYNAEATIKTPVLWVQWVSTHQEVDGPQLPGIESSDLWTLPYLTLGISSPVSFTMSFIMWYNITWQRAPLVVQMVKIPPANAGDISSIHGLGRFPGEEKSSPLWYSCLGNPMDRGAWWATVHGVSKESDTT